MVIMESRDISLLFFLLYTAVIHVADRGREAGEALCVYMRRRTILGNARNEQDEHLDNYTWWMFWGVIGKSYKRQNIFH